MKPSIAYLIDDGIIVIDGDRRYTVDFLRQMDYGIVTDLQAERAAMQARIAEMLRLLQVAASVSAALRAIIDDTDWDTDDHDGKFGHVPYATFVEAARLLARSEQAQAADELAVFNDGPALGVGHDGNTHSDPYCAMIAPLGSYEAQHGEPCGMCITAALERGRGVAR